MRSSNTNVVVLMSSLSLFLSRLESTFSINHEKDIPPMKYRIPKKDISISLKNKRFIGCGFPSKMNPFETDFFIYKIDKY